AHAVCDGGRRPWAYAQQSFCEAGGARRIGCSEVGERQGARAWVSVKPRIEILQNPQDDKADDARNGAEVILNEVKDLCHGFSIQARRLLSTLHPSKRALARDDGRRNMTANGCQWPTSGMCHDVPMDAVSRHLREC